MSEHPTPDILFLVFNRPLLTQAVFDAIKKSRPSRIFIAADGPRKNNESDAILCKKVRDIVNQVNWECEIKTLFREENLGCRTAITSAIDWFFDHTDAGIILEDDCLPSESFFNFCALTLEKYKSNEKIMQINGSFHLSQFKSFDESYYFSKLNSCWGWATWKRAWEMFDADMIGYEESRDRGEIDKYYENRQISNWMISYLEEANSPSCGIWSTQWSYSILKNNGLCINPTFNLVNNIGFFDAPTSGIHESFSAYSDYMLENFSHIKHPDKIQYDVSNDVLEFKNIIQLTDPRLLNKGLINFIKRAIKTVLNLFHER
jgi:hypothetical protein